MESKITVSKNYWPFNIEEVEKKYNAVYMGDFSLQTKSGHWSDSPAAIFYVENPDISKGHSHYFGLFIRYNDPIDPDDTSVLITRGDSAFSEPLQGIKADNGEVIVSCYRHHYIESEDKSVMIDGGPGGYNRYRGDKDRLVRVIIDGPNLKINLENN